VQLRLSVKNLESSFVVTLLAMNFSLIQIPLLGLSLLASSLAANTSALSAKVEQAAEAKRWVEIKQTNGTVTFNGKQVKAGDRLQGAQASLRTTIGSSAILAVEDGISTINVAENTTLQVKSLKTLLDGSKTTRLYLEQGLISSRVRPFTNSNSSYEIETPGGIAGTRGTEFGVTVSPNGKTGISSLKGKIAVTAKGQTVMVEPGYSALIFPGEVPTKPQQTLEDTRLQLKVLSVTGDGQVRVMAQVNPINLVSINEQVVNSGREGKIDQIVPLPANRQIKVVVRSSFGNQQVYELEVPPAAPALPQSLQGK
jgi:hypothetical protein